MMEEVMGDVAAADPRWRCLLLRYFNPVGAHPSGGCWAGVGLVARAGVGLPGLQDCLQCSSQGS
jgi:hypothetical protein